jgi:hypothetical protein
MFFLYDFSARSACPGCRHVPREHQDFEHAWHTYLLKKKLKNHLVFLWCTLGILMVTERNLGCTTHLYANLIVWVVGALSAF